MTAQVARIAENAEEAGLAVMGLSGVLGILVDRETVPLDVLAGLTPEQVQSLYFSYIAPAIDAVEQVLMADV